MLLQQETTRKQFATEAAARAVAANQEAPSWSWKQFFLCVLRAFATPVA
jgi:hypothetical protein